ncbi:MAG: DNA adenine methylase [Clostridia bacterium]|jgi:DNA adenine methylase
MVFFSPLRYPGGKNKLAKFVTLVCEKNNINGHYVEPYAGGASVAIHLLINGIMSEITINDYDRSVYAFWYSVLFETEKLCKKIEETEVTMKSWHIQKMIQKRKESSELLELGFSTFFLNRTNRSGVICGGVIGGLEQKGNYKINCRYNKKDLIKRIRLISERRDKIHLYNLDALDLIKIIEKKGKNRNTIFYFDPPYFHKGQSLYMNSYEHNDHKKVSEAINKIKNSRWIVSYDNVPEIQSLYKKAKKIDYSFIHVSYTPRVGNESLFFSKNLIVPKVGNPVKV